MMVVTTGAIKQSKVLVKSSPPTYHQPNIFTGRMPFLSPNQQCHGPEGKTTTTATTYYFLFDRSSLLEINLGHGTCPKDLQENLWGFLGWGEIFTGLMP